MEKIAGTCTPKSMGHFNVKGGGKRECEAHDIIHM